LIVCQGCSNLIQHQPITIGHGSWEAAN
jgi:hypothetical protein